MNYPIAPTLDHLGDGQRWIVAQRIRAGDRDAWGWTIGRENGDAFRALRDEVGVYGSAQIRIDGQFVLLGWRCRR